MRVYFDAARVSVRDYDEIVVLYHLVARKILALNGIGAEIWRIVFRESSIDVEDIAHRITNIYDVAFDVAFRDAGEFVNALVEVGVFVDDESIIVIDQTTTREIEDRPWGETEGPIIAMLKEKDVLYTAMFELTYQCNEKCVHCYVDQSDDDQGLDVPTCMRLIDELLEMKCLHLIFSGGDPFMFKGFVEVYIYARLKGFVCDIYTNGQYLADHKELIDDIVALHPRAFFISLYGASAATHDSVTQIKGSFDKTLMVSRKIVSCGVPLVFNMMLMRDNTHQIEEMVLLAKEIGADYRIGLSYVYTNKGDSAPMEFFVAEKSVVKKVFALSESRVTSMNEPVKGRIFHENDTLCGAGENAICVSPNGDVYPCVSMKWRMGNVFDNSLRTIWKGDARRKLLEKARWRNAIACHACEYKNGCQHCIAMSHNENGDMLACNTCDRLIAESWIEFHSEKAMNLAQE